MTESRNGRVPPAKAARPRVPTEYATWDAAYVLGALPDADRHEFETHMAGCASCRDAVAELVTVAPLLTLLNYDEVVAD